MNFIKHSYAFSTALAVTLVYALYGLLLHYRPDFVAYHAQILHLRDASAVSVPSLHAVAVSSAYLFVIVFVISFITSLIYNLCAGSCWCSKD